MENLHARYKWLIVDSNSIIPQNIFIVTSLFLNSTIKCINAATLVHLYEVHYNGYTTVSECKLETTKIYFILSTY